MLNNIIQSRYNQIINNLRELERVMNKKGKIKICKSQEAEKKIKINNGHNKLVQGFPSDQPYLSNFMRKTVV